MNPETVAAVVSSIAAVVAVGVGVHTLTSSLGLSAMVALEQRFGQINHAKVSDPELWQSICNESLEPLSDAAKHLVFETFQFYQQALHMHERGILEEDDVSVWKQRLASDLKRYGRYREWWSSEDDDHDAWNRTFVRHVNSEIERLKVKRAEADDNQSRLDFLAAEKR